MELDALKKLHALGYRPTLEIHAFEGVIYLIKILTELGDTMLKKEDGENWVFKSSTEAGVALADAGGKHAWIIHQCTHDEVIGHEPCLSEDPVLRTPMNLKLMGGVG